MRLALARVLGRPPRAVEAAIVEHVHVDDLSSSVEVSGPGFVNLTLRQEWLESEMQAFLADDRLGVPLQDRQQIPIDYSAPNLSKEMHFGHLRTTVVGDRNLNDAMLRDCGY